MVIVGSVVDNDFSSSLMLLVDACDCCNEPPCPALHGLCPPGQTVQGRGADQFRVVARALSQGVSDVITVDIHEKEVLKSFFVPARNLSLAKDIGPISGA